MHARQAELAQLGTYSSNQLSATSLVCTVYMCHWHAGAPGAVDQGLFATLHAYVQINPALAPIAERLQLKRLVPMEVDQAIVEIITPVVERSATIACMTAQELIVKVSQAALQLHMCNLMPTFQ